MSREIEVTVKSAGVPLNRTKEGVDLPTMAIVFNPQVGGLSVAFDTLDIPSWEMAAMILHGAYEHAMAQIRVAHSLALRNMVAQAQQDQIIRAQVEKPKGIFRP